MRSLRVDPTVGVPEDGAPKQTSRHRKPKRGHIGLVKEEEALGLICPFPTAVFPDMEQVHQRTLEWAASFGLLDSANSRSRISTEKYTALVGLMLPYGTAERFQVVSDFTTMLFWHDDLCDDSAIGSDPERMASGFRSAIDLLLDRAEPRPDVPLDRVLCDLRDRFERLAPDPVWMLRFVASMQDYFDACLWEAENRRRAAPPTSGSFVPIRPFAGALWVYLQFVDFLLGRPLPLTLRADPDVQALQLITCNVVCWHNDIYSLQKELAAGDVHNLVLVLGHERGVDVEAARLLATRCSNAEVGSFLTIAAKLRGGPGGPDPVLDGYVRALEVFIRGAWEWSRDAIRYASPPASGSRAVTAA